MFEGKKLDRIYKELDDKHTSSVVLYADGNDLGDESKTIYLYVDKECTEKIDGATLKELFVKKLLLIAVIIPDDNDLLYINPVAGCPGPINTGSYTVLGYAGEMDIPTTAYCSKEFE